MSSNTITKGLRDNRRSTMVWTAAISAVGGLYSALWPTIDGPGFQQAIDSYPEGLLEALNYQDIATPAGYLTSSVYGLIAAVLMLIYASSAGARCIAGDEQAGTLDLIAAHPITRTQLGLQRFGAAALNTILTSVFFFTVMIALRSPAQLTEISVTDFAAMHLHLTLFALMFGAIAYAAGAATGSRGLALAAGAIVAVLGYLANGLLPMVDGLESVNELSPFNWLVGGQPLHNGAQISGLITMTVITGLLLAAGTWAFNQRDLTV